MESKKMMESEILNRKERIGLIELESERFEMIILESNSLKVRKNWKEEINFSD